MSKKSTLCKSSRTQKPLTEYDSQHDADQAASHYEDMVSYRCDRCMKWHLSPKRAHTPCATCMWCTGRDGHPKQSYTTQEDARRRANLIKTSRRVALVVYKCRWGEGWHLTKA